jgi:hypothetical protein
MLKERGQLLLDTLLPRSFYGYSCIWYSVFSNSMLDTVTVNGHMVVIISVVPNQWGYLIVTLGPAPGRQVRCTMVDRSLTRAEAVSAAVSTLTLLGVL